ncbi:MAG: hypothetical protein M1824_006428 [Vezdaea acicularis]|nr:MAG: hypothetical protein M1824_006428 [Vezdaea acicularis]
MASQIDNARRTAEAKAAITESLASVGSGMDASMQTRASTIHANSAALNKQQADVAKQTSKLEKQSDQWQKMADTSHGQLKEIGDIQNWAERIERDLLVVEETLRIAEEEGQNGHANGHAPK